MALPTFTRPTPTQGRHQIRPEQVIRLGTTDPNERLIRTDIDAESDDGRSWPQKKSTTQWDTSYKKLLKPSSRSLYDSYMTHRRHRLLNWRLYLECLSFLFAAFLLQRSEDPTCAMVKPVGGVQPIVTLLKDPIAWGAKIALQEPWCLFHFPSGSRSDGK